MSRLSISQISGKFAVCSTLLCFALHCEEQTLYHVIFYPLIWNSLYLEAPATGNRQSHPYYCVLFNRKGMTSLMVLDKVTCGQLGVSDMGPVHHTILTQPPCGQCYVIVAVRSVAGGCNGS